MFPKPPFGMISWLGNNLSYVEKPTPCLICMAPSMSSVPNLRAWEALTLSAKKNQMCPHCPDREHSASRGEIFFPAFFIETYAEKTTASVLRQRIYADNIRAVRSFSLKCSQSIKSFQSLLSSKNFFSEDTYLCDIELVSIHTMPKFLMTSQCGVMSDAEHCWKRLSRFVPRALDTEYADRMPPRRLPIRFLIFLCSLIYPLFRSQIVLSTRRR